MFLDRDGVLIEEVDLLRRPEQATLDTGVAGALERLHEAGFALIAITNQTVVARGLATLEDVAIVHERIDSMLREAGAPALDGWYVCPHHPHATVPALRVVCECRKPRPGLIKQAAEEHRIALDRSFLIGDRITDVAAGQAAGCTTVQLRRGAHLAPPIVVVDPLPEIEPDHRCNDIRQATDWILARRG